MENSAKLERLSVIGLHLAPEIGPHRFKNIVDRFGSARAALGAAPSDIAAVEGLPPKVARSLDASKLIESAEKELENAQKAGVEIITCADNDYPECFKNIPGGPIVIYVKGKMLPRDILSVAIVGTRRPTSYGRAAAGRFAREFAEAGVTTVSGLARGIDTDVHVSSVSAGGRTIAFLGNGLSRHYPPENARLEEKIVENGALISEFSMDTGPDKGNFPRRNRLISAFSLATLVVEADEKSGALITAKHCADQGKDVFAVPGPVFSKYSSGPHMLIKQGARLAERAQDILDEIAPLAGSFAGSLKKITPPPDEMPLLDATEEKIMDLLGRDMNGMSADYLSASLKLSPAEIFPSLTTLELKGLAKCMPGKIYVKNMR